MDVIVVGAGAIGLAVAWRSARIGLRVIVADPSPGSGASHVAAGMLAPASEATFGEERLIALAFESWRRYPEFIAELEAQTGMTTGYVECGSLLVATDLDEKAALEREHRFKETLGLQVELLDRNACRSLEPALAPRVRAGLLSANDRQVDPRRLVRALRSACAAEGVAFELANASLLTNGDQVTGVQLDTGRTLAADAVVLCAGSWTATVPGLPADATPPVRPVKGQILRLHGGDGPLASRMIRGVSGVYITPRPDGEVVVGSTVEERGFDTRVDARAIYELLRDAHELVPDVLELELSEATAGLRPGTPDNAPIIGATSLERLYFATGHYRNGILLAPITADAIASLLAGSSPPAEVAPFSATRFGTEARVAL